MTQKYSYIEGCPACQRMQSIIKQGGSTTGRLDINHSQGCRKRIMEAMMDDPIDRHVVEAYRKRYKGNDEDKEDDTTHETGNPVAQHLTQKEAGLETVLLHMTLSSMDIAEVYSPVRVTEMAKKFGLREGWALHLTTRDHDGKPWDFDCPEMRNRAIRKLLSDRPKLLVGSPMCTGFSSWRCLNHTRMPKEVVEQRFGKARRHLRFCAQL